MISFRKLFCFSSVQVDMLFKAIDRKYYGCGIKLLHANPSSDAHIEGKLLVITPRRAGKAHVRNLIRRRIKNIFYQQALYKSPGVWIALVGHQAAQASFAELQDFLVKKMSC